MSGSVVSNTSPRYAGGGGDSPKRCSQPRSWRYNIVRRPLGISCTLYCDVSGAIFFRYDQWNCSVRSHFFQNIYRESAFMYSIASSAITYSVAKACSEGTLAGCKCGDHGKRANTVAWHWGGCADNFKFAKKFTKKFLQLRKKTEDFVNSIVNYNSQLGIKVVQENEERFCQCHGVSGYSKFI